jgi:hypothetical protein
MIPTGALFKKSSMEEEYQAREKTDLLATCSGAVGISTMMPRKTR